MPKKILAVDDSATVRDFLKITLEGAGYQVVLAGDGIEAKKVLETSAENHFDMVLTDLNMPNMNGIELIRDVRQRPGYRFKPILMLTNENQDDVKKEGKVAGASCWLNKPFSAEKLLAVLKVVLPL